MIHRKGKNKARYTAISCGRVGRGGNTRFPTFQLERDGPTNQPTNQPTNGRTKPLLELHVRNNKWNKNSNLNHVFTQKRSSEFDLEWGQFTIYYANQ